jgi:hypothetical protein
MCFLKGWNHALEMSKHSDDQWALYAKAFLDRTRLALATKGEEYHDILQPSAEYLGSLLGIEQWTVRGSINRTSFYLFSYLHTCIKYHIYRLTYLQRKLSVVDQPLHCPYS